MPSQGGSATLISAPHLGDLVDVVLTAPTDTQALRRSTAGSDWINQDDPAESDSYAGLTDVDTAGQVDHQVYAWDATAGKYEPLPGVVGDGAGGVQIGAAITAGDPAAAEPVYHHLAGLLSVRTTPATLGEDDQAIQAVAAGTLAANLTNNVMLILRDIDRNGHALTQGMFFLANVDASGGAHPIPDDEPIMQYDGGLGGYQFAFNHAGGLGLFRTVPPTAQPAITGALSTVLDAPAKAVLTSIIAALVGCGLASDGTT